MQGLPAALCLAPMVATIGLSYLFNHAARRAAPFVGLIDKPDGGRKTHHRATPVMGGVAFMAAVAAVVCLSFGLAAPWFAAESARQLAVSLGTSAIGFCLLGVIDDRWALTPRVKLVGQILASLPFVALNGAVETVGFLGWEIPLGPVGGAFTVLWLVACANVVNLIDGLDGLAGSIGLVAMTTISALFVLRGHPEEAILTTIIAGGLVGFLIHNWPPAKIFMGDAGSMTIGFLAGALSIQAASKTATTFTLAVPVVLMSVPIFDTAMAILRRKLTGRSIGEGDRGHIHHRLQDRGLSRQQALLAIAGLSLIMAGAVLISVTFNSEAAAVAICAGVLVLLILARVFGYHETSLVFRHLEEIGELLVDTSGVFRTRMLLARLDGLDPKQRAQLWDHVVSRVAQMKATRLNYRCRAKSDNRITTRLSWEASDADVRDRDASWHVEYRVPRENGLVAVLEAQGFVGDDQPPRMDDLFRLFAKVGLELPTHNEGPPEVVPLEEAATLPFPGVELPLPARQAA